MKRLLTTKEPYHVERGGKVRRKLPVAPQRFASPCNAEQLAPSCNAEQLASVTTVAPTSIAVVDVATSLAELVAGSKTNRFCQQIQSVLVVDVHLLVIVQYGLVTDEPGGLKAFYEGQLHQMVVDIWNRTVAQPVNLVYNIHGNTIVVAAASAPLQWTKVYDVSWCTREDFAMVPREEIALVGAYEFSSGTKLIVAVLSWRTSMPRQAAVRNMGRIKAAIRHGVQPNFKDDVPVIICGCFNNKVMHTGGLLFELGGEFDMVSEGPSNPLLHAMFQGCQALHGGEDTLNNGAFHFVVTDENFMTPDHRSTSTKVSERSAEQPACKKEHVTLNPRNALQDQHSTRKKVSERSAEQHACKKELVTLKSFNAVQRYERKIRVQQVTLTPKVYTYYERFLNNLTAHATENQQLMLENVFQRYAGGNVAYYGRRGVCQGTPYSLAEKVDTMLQEAEKRRNLYIATLPSGKLRRTFSCNAEQSSSPRRLSNYHLNKMMVAWEHDYESWMHEEQWKGFHK